MIKPRNIVVIGSAGTIGRAFIRLLSNTYASATIYAFSRQPPEHTMPGVHYYAMDYADEASIKQLANIAAKTLALDLVIVTNGILHDGAIMPEKSLKDLSAAKFQHLFAVNAITPALIAKYFLPKLNKQQPARFAVLSARIGSISDNRLGGWYAYRASKAALNMIIKNAAIEMSRRNKQAIIVGLHPGTVDSPLSQPFQANVPDGNLFTPEDAVMRLLHVLRNLTPQASGKCFAWDGAEIMP